MNVPQPGEEGAVFFFKVVLPCLWGAGDSMRANERCVLNETIGIELPERVASPEPVITGPNQRKFSSQKSGVSFFFPLGGKK